MTHSATVSAQTFRATTFDVEAYLDEVLDQVARFRRRFPLENYQGRLYTCSACRSLHACVAPLDDLVDDYPCPECGDPQRPLVPPSSER